MDSKLNFIEASNPFEKSFVLKNHHHIISKQKTITAKKTLGRNDFCFCGSGKKYKFCCIDKRGII